MTTARRILSVAVACAAFAACTSSGISGDRRNVGSVTLTFRVEPSQAKAGQSIRLTMRAVNNGGTPVKLTFSTGQRYDFWLTLAGREIWRWSSDRAFTQDTGYETIPGQSLISFAESWTATAGSFVAHGRLTAETYNDTLTGRLEVG